jgi:hypothetical protein
MKIFELEYTSGHSLSSMLIQGQLHMFVPYPGWPQSSVRVWQAQVFLQSKIKCLQKLSRLGDDDDDDYNDDNEKGGIYNIVYIIHFELFHTPIIDK